MSDATDEVVRSARLTPPAGTGRRGAGALLACAIVACGPPAKIAQLCDAWGEEGPRGRAEALVALSSEAEAIRDDEVVCVSSRLSDVAATVDYVCGSRMRTGEAQPRSDSSNVLERAHSLQFGLLQGVRALFSDPRAQLRVEVDELVQSCRADAGALSDRSKQRR